VQRIHQVPGQAGSGMQTMAAGRMGHGSTPGARSRPMVRGDRRNEPLSDSHDDGHSCRQVSGPV